MHRLRSPWMLAAAFALLFGAGLLVHLDRVGIGDWDYFTSWSLVLRDSVVEYHQWPSWTPWHCGGTAVAENYQGRLLSPSLLLVLAFGPVAGNRLWMLVALALGFEGARRLARALGAAPWAAPLAALAVAANGGVFLRMAVGHLGDVPYLFLPWLLLGVRRAWTDPRRGAFAAGAWGALCWVEAGIYPLVYGWLLAGAWSVGAAVQDRTWRPLTGAGLAALACGALAAPSLVPVLHLLPFVVREGVAPESIPLAALVPIFLGRVQSLLAPPAVEGISWGWHEYGTYVGPVFLLGLGVALARGGRAVLGWAAAGCFYLVLGLGDLGSASPWTLLHHLPVFGSMRASGRAFQPALLCFGLAMALGISRLPRILPVLVLGLALDLFLVGTPVLREPWLLPFPEATPGAGFRQVADLRHRDTLWKHNYTYMVEDIRAGRGVLICYDPVHPKTYARERPDGREAVVEGRAGPVETRVWTPNRLVLEVPPGDTEARVIVNQNAHRNWTIRGPGTVEEAGGLLAARLPAGVHRVELVHRPLGVLQGLAVLGLGVLLVVALTRRRPR